MNKDKEKLLEWLYKLSGKQQAALIQTARPFKKGQEFLRDFPRNTLSISPMVSPKNVSCFIDQSLQQLLTGS
jgi:hypothetical protein